MSNVHYLPNAKTAAAERPISPSATLLDPNLIAAQADGGRLILNLIFFVRLLRHLGFPVGTSQVVDVLNGLNAVGVEDPDAFYWTLHGLLVTRHSQRRLFDQAYFAFWKDPDYIKQMMSVILPQRRGDNKQRGEPLARRLQELLAKVNPDALPEPPPQLDFDASATWSNREVFNQRDFEEMSNSEAEAARKAMASLFLPRDQLLTRRLIRNSPRGERLDLRALLRQMGRYGGDFSAPRFSKRRRRQPPLVILCDISGSMDRYARLFLHFIHAVTSARDEVHAFLFGTRLTPISHLIIDRDVDVALAKVAKATSDWSGGTRLGESLKRFNRQWATRVLSGNALVLLFTDGIDREGGEGVMEEMQRLRRRARHIFWLNPLLRYDQYRPEAAGAKALMAMVDSVHPCHNLASLADLCGALSHPQAIATAEYKNAPTATVS